MDVFQAHLYSNELYLPKPVGITKQWIITENGRWWRAPLTFGDDEVLARGIAAGLNETCHRCQLGGQLEVQNAIREALGLPTVDA